MIQDWGVPLDKITLLCVLGSKPGLDAVQRAWPALDIWYVDAVDSRMHSIDDHISLTSLSHPLVLDRTGAVDKELTPEGYIKPGLGDTGDRLFNTI